MKAQNTFTSLFDPRGSMDRLFADWSVAGTLRRVLSGLQSGPGTADYYFARSQLPRLWSYAAAVVIPCIVLMLLTHLNRPFSPDEEGVGMMVLPADPPPKPLEPLPKTEPLRLPMDETAVSKGLEVSTVQVSADTVPDPAPPATLDRPQSFAAPVKSPVKFPGLHPYRGAEGRGEALSAEGASGTSTYVLRALRWLKECQEVNGSWLAESGGKQTGRHATGHAPAMTALALLTFLAHGETPVSEEFGQTVESAMRWLVGNQDADGRFRGRDSHDYSQPIATYALCEAWGMTRIPVVGESATRAARVLIDGQQPSGGWDYQCNRRSDRSDLSYAGWCVQALKAAQVAGIQTPGLAEAMKRAVTGLNRHAAPSGGFGYTGPGQTPLTAVAVLGLQMLGETDSASVRAGLSWLERATCDWDKPWSPNPLYHWYYVTQAKHREGGETWERWRPKFAETLCRHQVVVKRAGEAGQELGYWPCVVPTEHCQSLVYNTTLCALTLQVYYRYRTQGLGTYMPLEHAPVSGLREDGDDIRIVWQELGPTT